MNSSNGSFGVNGYSEADVARVAFQLAALKTSGCHGRHHDDKNNSLILSSKNCDQVNSITTNEDNNYHCNVAASTSKVNYIDNGVSSSPPLPPAPDEHLLRQYSNGHSPLPFNGLPYITEPNCNFVKSRISPSLVPFSQTLTSQQQLPDASQHDGYSSVEDFDKSNNYSYHSCHWLSDPSDTLEAYIVGPGLQNAARGRTSTFFIITHEDLSKQFKIKVQILVHNGHYCPAPLKQIGPRKITVQYKPDFLGLHRITVYINGSHAKGSPTSLDVASKHEYESCREPSQIITGDDRSFTFYDPWGVCCNADGIIYVSDRGNHKIRAFTPNLLYSHSIGSHGSRPGQLNKPAGIAVNSEQHIVVADKDNHRIQVFSNDGDIVLSFGEEGSESWQLKYPWGIAIAPKDTILVGDSRNGRISMFSSAGLFLRHFADCDGVLKNPRGIIYRQLDGRILAADMNKHQIIVIDTQSDSYSADDPHGKPSHPSCIGNKGSSTDELDRPQGVACDMEGYVFVSDSRNSRIQIYDVEGNHLNHWSIDAPNTKKASRPTGICVTPSGDVLVVDSEYNRVIKY